MAVMLVLAGLSPLYVELQYTKTAAVVTAAGYVLLFIGGQKAEKWKKAFVQALGILLLLLGSWIRSSPLAWSAFLHLDSGLHGQ